MMFIVVRATPTKRHGYPVGISAVWSDYLLREPTWPRGVRLSRSAPHSQLRQHHWTIEEAALALSPQTGGLPGLQVLEEW